MSEPSSEFAQVLAISASEVEEAATKHMPAEVEEACEEKCQNAHTEISAVPSTTEQIGQANTQQSPQRISLLGTNQDLSITKPVSETIQCPEESNLLPVRQVLQSEVMPKILGEPICLTAETSTLTNSKLQSGIKENVGNEPETEKGKDNKVHKLQETSSGEGVSDSLLVKDGESPQCRISLHTVLTCASSNQLSLKDSRNQSVSPKSSSSPLTQSVSAVESISVADISDEHKHVDVQKCGTLGDIKRKVYENKRESTPTNPVANQIITFSTLDYETKFNLVRGSNLQTNEHAYTKSSGLTSLCTSSDMTKTGTINSDMEDTVMAGPFYLSQPNNPAGIPVCIRVPRPKTGTGTKTKLKNPSIYPKPLQELSQSSQALLPNFELMTGPSTTAQSAPIRTFVHFTTVKEQMNIEKDTNLQAPVSSHQTGCTESQNMHIPSSDLPLGHTGQSGTTLSERTSNWRAATLLSSISNDQAKSSQDKPLKSHEHSSVAPKPLSPFLLTSQGLVLTSGQSALSKETLVGLNFYNSYTSGGAPMESVLSQRNKTASLYTKDGKHILLLPQRSNSKTQVKSKEHHYKQNVSSNSMESVYLKQQAESTQGLLKLSDNGPVGTFLAPQPVAVSSGVGPHLISSNDISLDKSSGTSLVMTPSNLRPISSSGMHIAKETQNPNIIILKSREAVSKHQTPTTSVGRTGGFGISDAANISPNTVVTVVHARKSDPQANVSRKMPQLARVSSEIQNSEIIQFPKLSGHQNDAAVRKAEHVKSVSQFSDGADRVALKNPVYSTTVKTGEGAVPVMVVAPNLDEDSSDSYSEKAVTSLAMGELNAMDDGQDMSKVAELSTEETDSDTEMEVTEEQDISVLAQLLRARQEVVGSSRKETLQSSKQEESNKLIPEMKSIIPKTDASNIFKTGESVTQHTSALSRLSDQSQENQSVPYVQVTKQSLLSTMSQQSVKASHTCSGQTKKDSGQQSFTLPGDNLHSQGNQSNFEKTKESLLHSMLKNTSLQNGIGDEQQPPTVPEPEDPPETPGDDECFGIRIESVYSLTDQAEFDNTIAPAMETSEPEPVLFNVRDSDLWKSAVQPCFVVLERLSKSEISAKQPLNQSKCSRHCRKRTLDYLCNLHLLTCVNHPDVSQILKPKKAKLSKLSDTDSMKTSTEGSISIKKEISPTRSNTLTHLLQKVPVALSVSPTSNQSASYNNTLSVPVINGLPDSLSKTPALIKTAPSSLLKTSPTSVTKSPQTKSTKPLPCTSVVSTPHTKVVPDVTFKQSDVKHTLTEKTDIISEDNVTEELVKHSDLHLDMTESHNFQWHCSQLQSQVDKKREIMQELKNLRITKDKQKERQICSEKTSDSKKAASGSEKLKISPSFIMQPRNSKKSSQRIMDKQPTPPLKRNNKRSSTQVAAQTSPLITTAKGTLQRIVPQGTFTVSKSSAGTVLTPTPTVSHPPAEKVKAALSSLSTYLTATGRKVSDVKSQFILLKVGSQHFLVKISPSALLQHAANVTKSVTTPASGVARKANVRTLNVASTVPSSSVKKSIAVTKPQTGSLEKSTTLTTSKVPQVTLSKAPPAQQSVSLLSCTSSSGITTQTTATPALVSLLASDTTTNLPQNRHKRANINNTNATSQVEPISRSRQNVSNLAQECPANSRQRGYGDPSSILSHLPPNSTMLPERRAETCTLTDVERQAKRRRLEAKYPLPPGVVVKSEPDDPEYEKNLPIISHVFSSATARGTASSSVAKSATVHVVSASSSAGNLTEGRASGPSSDTMIENFSLNETETMSYETQPHEDNEENINIGKGLTEDSTFELENVLFSETLEEMNDNTEATSEEPPPLIDERVEGTSAYPASLSDEEGTDSADEMPPLLQPMFPSTSITVPDAEDRDTSYDPFKDSTSDPSQTVSTGSDKNTWDGPKVSRSFASLQSCQPVIRADSGFSSRTPSASSSVSGISSLASPSTEVTASTSVNLKIQRLKELLKKKEQEVENMRKKQSELPVLDIDDD